MKKIILASASPRRKELLETLNLDFIIQPANIDENIEGIDFSYKLIEDLALAKAENIAQKTKIPSIIIGSDTVVVIDNHILGKPVDETDAKNMLKTLSGKTHEVVSAIAVIDTQSKKVITEAIISKVKFKNLSDNEIDNYVNTKEPLDKAGAYGIQGIASVFVESIEGCYNNIVGISTFALAKILNKFGIKVI